MLPDRGMELELETGNAPMLWPRPVKHLSDGYRTVSSRSSAHDLLDRG